MSSKIWREGVSRAEWARRRKWITRALVVEAALVATFVWCCCQFLAYQPEPDVLTVVKEVPVKVTVAPDVSEDQDGPSDAALALARVLWGECRGCPKTEQAAVAWVVLNRVDRITALGNAVVPQQAYPIFKAIYDLEEAMAV